MKCDIEVVGERCRRKNEPRSTHNHDVTAAARARSAPAPSANWAEEKKARETLQRRKVQQRPAHSLAVSSSWRRPTFHRSRGRLGDRDPISQEQLGVKVRISYVDYKGQVHTNPGSSKAGKSRTVVEGMDKTTEYVHLHDVDARAVSPWGSSVSIIDLGGPPPTPYRPKSMVSTRDKILSSALDKHFVNTHPDASHAQIPDTDTESENFRGPFITSPLPSLHSPMPSVHTPLPRLTTSSASSNPPAYQLPKTSSPEGSQHTDMFRADSSSSASSTPRSATPHSPTVTWAMDFPSSSTANRIAPKDKALSPIMNGSCANGTELLHEEGRLVTTVPNRKHGRGKLPSVMNGIHAQGKGPTSSDIMNGVCTKGTATTWSASTKRDESHVTPYDKCRRAATSLPGKRVHFSASAMMTDYLRHEYQYRRVQSAGRGWRGSVSMAFFRLRSQRKQQEEPAAEVKKDENAPPTVSRLFRKFRMVGFITVTLIRLKAAIVVNSLDRTERSAAEIQWRTLYGQQEAEKLAFTKSYYSRERISTKMPCWALEIFDVAPEDRTEHDCRRLHALFRGMRSFDKFTEEIQLNLCRSFSYTCVSESRIILRRGHIGHNFYFIYSGSVFVNVPDVDSEGELFIKTEAVLARGDSFGELALLKDILRTATVSVRETCELLVVDKDVFSQVCPKIFEKELMEKKNFVSRMSLFSSKWWNADALSYLCMEAQIQEYKINKIVVENNTTEDWLYICMEGQCQVIRCLSEDKGEEEEEERKRKKQERESSVILSDEIIELLSSASKVGKRKEEEEDDKKSSDKEKLLYSLGLEYVDSGKRSGVFLEEVEEEERRKAFLSSSGPMTLTALMAQKRKEGKTGLVYVKVGTLESEDVFDMVSLVKPPIPRTHSALLLVSCGARMLRVKKALFLRLASPQALEHTKTVVSKNPFPSEATIKESYRNKVSWSTFKSEVVNDVIRSREPRNAPLYRNRDTDHLKKKTARTKDQAHKERGSRSRTRTKAPRSRSHAKPDQAKSTTVTTENDDPKKPDDICKDSLSGNGMKEHAERQHSSTLSACNEESDDAVSQSEESEEEDRAADDELSGSEKDSTKELSAPARIFPVVEVNTNPDPDTPREEQHPVEKEPEESCQPVTLKSEVGLGPGPEAVIVRRRSSTGASLRPLVSVDTTFVTRRRRSHAEGPPTSGHVTRFNLTDEVNSETVAENM